MNYNAPNPDARDAPECGSCGTVISAAEYYGTGRCAACQSAAERRAILVELRRRALVARLSASLSPCRVPDVVPA